MDLRFADTRKDEAAIAVQPFRPLDATMAY
jgi:hypothetical protein